MNYGLDEKRNKIYQELVELANENMAALKKISEWEFLGPKVERFEKWLENEFFYFDTGNAEEKRLKKSRLFPPLQIPLRLFRISSQTKLLNIKDSWRKRIRRNRLRERISIGRDNF